METDASLFDFNPDSGEIEYIPAEEEMEGVENESNEFFGENPDTGSEVPGGEQSSEILPEESGPSDSGPGTGSVLSSLDAVETEQLYSALLASAPASGSLSSSTLDYFDRLVSGLPDDFVYVAYRNDNNDSYAGTIIYGDDYDLSGGDTVVFGDGAVSVDVSRISSSGYNNYITYDTSDASDSVITVVDSGTILYYTNAFDGYPVLGGYERPVGFSGILTVGLLSVILSVVLGKIINR